MIQTIKKIAGKILNPYEFRTAQAFNKELHISCSHRKGLKRLKSGGLKRPSKLNLGCGSKPKKGFTNVDLFTGDITLDLRRGLPFDADCCDLIFSEHCFEHFDYPKPIALPLHDCLRVLKKGGILSFSVPDTEWPLSDYAQGLEASYFKTCGEEQWHPENCVTRLEHINYHFRQEHEHQFAYDFETAKKLLLTVGFVDIERRVYDPTMDSIHRKIGSPFIRARKPL